MKLYLYAFRVSASYSTVATVYELTEILVEVEFSSSEINGNFQDCMMKSLFSALECESFSTLLKQNVGWVNT